MLLIRRSSEELKCNKLECKKLSKHLATVEIECDR